MSKNMRALAVILCVSGALAGCMPESKGSRVIVSNSGTGSFAAGDLLGASFQRYEEVRVAATSPRRSGGATRSYANAPREAWKPLARPVMGQPNRATWAATDSAAPRATRTVSADPSATIVPQTTSQWPTTAASKGYEAVPANSPSITPTRKPATSLTSAALTPTTTRVVPTKKTKAVQQGATRQASATTRSAAPTTKATRSANASTSITLPPNAKFQGNEQKAMPAFVSAEYVGPSAD